MFVQNYPEDKFEIIIVDDSSGDWSSEIIDSYGSFVEKVYLKENVGLSKARNIGVKQAKGEYILFVDADDYVHRDLLYAESMFLDHNPEWQAVAVDYMLVDDQEQDIKRISFEQEPLACGIMYRKEKFLEIGMFDETFKMHEDRDFRIRFTKKYRIYRIALPLYRYRKHDTNLSSNDKLSIEYWKKLKKKHQMND